MAKFCVKCGSKLGESGVCSCERVVEEMQAISRDETLYEAKSVPEERYRQVSGGEHEYGSTYHSEIDYSEKANQAKEVLSTGYNKVINILMNLVKYPFTKGIAFSNSEDIKSASMIISLHALFAAIFTVISFSRINEAFSLFNQFLSEMIGYGDMLTLKFPVLNIFVITLIGSVLFSMIYAGTLLVFSILFKNNVSYKTMVCAMASRSAAIIPVILFSIVLLFIMPVLSIVVFVMGNLAGIAYLTQVLPVTKKENRNQVPLIVFLGTIVFFAVTYFIFKNSYTLYLPSELKEFIPYFEELMKNPELFY